MLFILGCCSKVNKNMFLKEQRTLFAEGIHKYIQLHCQNVNQ